MWGSTHMHTCMEVCTLPSSLSLIHTNRKIQVIKTKTKDKLKKNWRRSIRSCLWAKLPPPATYPLPLREWEKRVKGKIEEKEKGEKEVIVLKMKKMIVNMKVLLNQRQWHKQKATIWSLQTLNELKENKKQLCKKTEIQAVYITAPPNI